MTLPQDATSNVKLRALVDEGCELLKQFPPSRHVRRLAGALHQVLTSSEQPLKLALVGNELDELSNLSQMLVANNAALQVQAKQTSELLSNPRAFGELVAWSDAALLARGSASSTAFDNRLLHCFSIAIAAGPQVDDYARTVPGLTYWTCDSVASDAIVEKLSSAARPLAKLTHARRLRSLAGSVQQLHSQSLQYHKLVVGQLEKPTKLAPRQMASDIDKTWIPMRDMFAERLIHLERELVVASERATQPLGELSGLLRSIVQSVSESDLERTKTNAQLKLSLNAGHLATLNRRFEHTLHERFTRELKQAERLVQAAMNDSTRQNADALALNESRLPSIDIHRAWRSVENLMAIGKEAAIELPRKGVFDLLTAGRQKVFIIIMFISLMGRMGLPKLFTTPAAHLGFGLFMAAVMIVSMISAIVRWRKENAQTVEKEIQKFRESLLSEGSKVIEQVERAKLNAIREYCKESTRSFESMCKAQLDNIARDQQARFEELQRRQEVTRKTLESRLKQISDLDRPVQRYVAAVEAYLESCQLDCQQGSVPPADVRVEEPVKRSGTTPRTKLASALAERRALRAV